MVGRLKKSKKSKISQESEHSKSQESSKENGGVWPHGTTSDFV